MTSKDGLRIDIHVVFNMTTYLEKWRMRLWKIGLSHMLRKCSSKKKDFFKVYIDAKLLVLCVLNGLYS